MMTINTNPYLPWITRLDEWVKAGRALPLGGREDPIHVTCDAAADKVLLFSPHPDDECITGALPLRLSREAGMQVVNIAVTLGSNVLRQAARWNEVQQACACLDWPVECAAPGGLTRITPSIRISEPDHWQAAVSVIRAVLQRHRPRMIVFPHAADVNGTHMGTHDLIMDALASMPADFRCGLIETEFWGAMAAPNLMVESSVEAVADLIAALSCHIGEVRRNPYHLTLPAWMQDNVRRGGEIVGGQGGVAPDYRFATLYHVSTWQKGARCEIPSEHTRFLPSGGKILRKWLEEIAWK